MIVVITGIEPVVGTEMGWFFKFRYRYGWSENASCTKTVIRKEAESNFKEETEVFQKHEPLPVDDDTYDLKTILLWTNFYHKGDWSYEFGMAPSLISDHALFK